MVAWHEALLGGLQEVLREGLLTGLQASSINGIKEGIGHKTAIVERHLQILDTTETGSLRHSLPHGPVMLDCHKYMSNDGFRHRTQLHNARLWWSVFRMHTCQR